ncbi:MAG: hypothetical protein PVH61_29905 [Candidatus Aminicenantes bacterium]|jgi:hypothetical protein
MAQNKVTKLIETTLNSRDHQWNEDSLVKVKNAWNDIDQNSPEFESVVHLLDKEALDKAGVDTTHLPHPRSDAGEVFDPATGCCKQGQSNGLLECLSIRGIPYFGCLVQCGEKRIKCVARRKHTWHQQYGAIWGGHHYYDIKTEQVDISGACFVQHGDGKLTRFFYHGNINAFSHADLTAPDTTPWRANKVHKPNWSRFTHVDLPTGKIPIHSNHGFESTGAGFHNPKVSPNFYFPGTLEYQIPGYKCSPGFTLCTPYLKVAVIGKSILICMAAVTLYKNEALLRRKYNKPFSPLQTTRKRNDYRGWSCRLFETKELP